MFWARNQEASQKLAVPHFTKLKSGRSHGTRDTGHGTRTATRASSLTCDNACFDSRLSSPHFNIGTRACKYSYIHTKSSIFVHPYYIRQNLVGARQHKHSCCKIDKHEHQSLTPPIGARVPIPKGNMFILEPLRLTRSAMHQTSSQPQQTPSPFGRPRVPGPRGVS